MRRRIVRLTRSLPLRIAPVRGLLCAKPIGRVEVRTDRARGKRRTQQRDARAPHGPDHPQQVAATAQVQA
jgi:hypothetical protein